MSIAPQAPGLGMGSVHVVGDPSHRIVLADGLAVEILASYPVRPDADLYSLAVAIEFRCGHCRHESEATLVAVRDHALLCPGCYADLDLVRGPPVMEIAPVQRSAA
ncbi:hypothetical protein B1813_03620 [Saccharomonospora piscinae]|uniref:Uncharacterized protein n=1 Tax=Saccharomonospora piscinae TaxID=687388 RepID=A0A1V9A975_SACPI|nr:hypothetical protein [Saccharomonospora piscinae]OQO93643.1 hypothetical protein B1813_03620 [Saccharomonospora piscinae]TLW94803.1 hypothetical protein FFT09_02760 [Saccharomonospora piscinae]